MWNFPKSDFHPLVNQLRDAASSCLCYLHSTSEPRCPLPRPQPPCLSPCHVQLHLPAHLPPRVTFLPVTWILSNRPLPGQGSAHSGGPQQCYQSPQDHDCFTVSCKLERKTFTSSMSPSDGGPTAWLLSLGLLQGLLQHLFTHPTPVLQGMDRCHQGGRDRRTPYRDIYPMLNCRQTLLLGLPGQAIFVFLLHIVNSPLRSLVFPSSPHSPCHLPSKYVHVSIPGKIRFRQQLTPPPHVNQLLQIDLECGGWDGSKKGWGNIQHIPQSNTYIIISDFGPPSLWLYIN